MNILKQTFDVYFSKKTSSARLDLRVIFDNYDEMSDSVREAFADGEAENEVEKITLRNTQHYNFNYLYLLGNLIDSEKPFEYFKDLFISTSETNSRLFAYQLANAEKDYMEYIQHNNFSKEFFDIYANSKRITLNRKLFEVVNKHFVPLRIDSKTDDIFYSYESADIKEIIFASIHFALENGYKLSKCKHCGKWFFVQSLKETYCTRKSTYPEYERYTCKEAVKYYKLPSNPASACGSMGKKKAESMQFWTKEEFDSFIKCISDKPLSKVVFYLFFYSGMREGELLALTLNDFDFDNNTVSITKNYARLGSEDIIHTPKTPKSKRTITLPAEIMEMVKEYSSML